MFLYFDAPDEVFDMFDSIQELNQAHYIDFYMDEKKSEPNLFSVDEWHPNSVGHTLIAKKVVDYIKKNEHYFFKGIGH